MKVRMMWNMQRGANLVLILAILAASGLALQANVADNPYSAIVDRNPFGLKDPPPPPPPVAENAPTTPPAKVTLTGLISMFGQPQALLEIIDEPGKGGGTPKKPILREGERMGAVEILQIDVDKNMVRIRNSGQETNLTFEVAKATGGVPGAAGAPVPTPAPPGAIPPPTGGPTVVGANAATGGGGVTLMGGATAALQPSIGTGADPNTGLRSIPTRPLRTDYNAGAQAPPMTSEQAEIYRSIVNSTGKGPPLPGAAPIDDGSGNPNPAPAPQFPQFPRPVPPGIPGR